MLPGCYPGGAGNRQARLGVFAYGCMCLLWAAVLTFFFGRDLTPTGNALTGRAFIFTDFVIYYMAGKVALDSPHHIYDARAQLQAFNEIVSPIHSTKTFMCQSPPYFFVMMMPFASIGFIPAFWIWRVLSLAAFWAALWLAAGSSNWVSRWQRALLLLAATVSFPAWIAFLVGQTSLFLVGVMAVAYLGLRGKRDIICGISLAVLAVKFQYLLFLAVPLLVLRRWKAIVVGGGIVGCFLLAAGALVGWDNVLEYPRILSHAETSPAYAGVSPEYMISVRGALSRFLPQAQALSVSSATLVVWLFLVGIIWVRHRRQKLSLSWAFSLTMLISLIAGAHVHVYDASLIAIPAALTLRAGVARMRDRVYHAFWISWCGLLIAYPFLTWLYAVLPDPHGVVMRYPFLATHVAMLAIGLALGSRH